MRDARIKVLKLLKPSMAERGYRYRAADDRFWRSQGDFTYHWQPRFIAGPMSAEVEPNLGLRSEVVERLFHATSTFPPNLQSGTSTIGSSLANLEGVGLRTYVYPVATNGDVPLVADKLLGLFDEKAPPYFEKFGSLEAIDHLLNDHPDEHTPHCPYGLARETRGLIVAKLVGRANYGELEAYYRSRIMKINSGFYAPQFEALVTSLACLQPGGGN